MKWEGALRDVDWDMATLAHIIFPVVKVRSSTHQKPSVDKSIRDALNACTAAYNSGLVSATWTNTKWCMDSGEW